MSKVFGDRVIRTEPANLSDYPWIDGTLCKPCSYRPAQRQLSCFRPVLRFGRGKGEELRHMVRLAPEHEHRSAGLRELEPISSGAATASPASHARTSGADQRLRGSLASRPRSSVRISGLRSLGTVMPRVTTWRRKA